MKNLYKVTYEIINANVIYGDDISNVDIVTYGDGYILVYSDTVMVNSELMEDTEYDTIELFIDMCNDLGEARTLKKSLLAEERLTTELKGIVVGGFNVPTDRNSQAMLSNAYTALKDNLVEYIDFKCSDGWTTITYAEIAPIVQAVATHIKECFSAERQISELIDTLDLQEIKDLDVVSEFDLYCTTN